MRKTADKTVYRTTSLYGSNSNCARIEVKDGKVVRTRPLEYYEKYSTDEVRDWQIEIENKGKIFKPMKMFPLPGMNYGWKNRIYSRNRIPFPMKRIDWDPDGERHPETRGASKFVHVSWDEALKIVHDEIVRVHEAYGLYSILYQGDGHGQDKTIGNPPLQIGGSMSVLRTYLLPFCA